MKNILTLLTASICLCWAEINNTYIRCEMNKWYTNITVDNATQIIMDYQPLNGSAYPAWKPARVSVREPRPRAGSQEDPLFITAAQQKSMRAWQLPMLLDSGRGPRPYSRLARTLCPSPYESQSNWPLLHLSTQSAPRHLHVQVELVEDLEVPLSPDASDQKRWKQVTVRTNEPKYFAFRFPPPPAPGPAPESPQTVILMLTSSNLFCATVSVQNLSCPVYDDEQTVKHRGDYFTMMDEGGITVSQERFPAGFYVVLLLKASDEECTGAQEAAPGTVALEPESRRNKTFRAAVVRTVSRGAYAAATGAVLGGAAAYVAAVAAAAGLARAYSRWRGGSALSVVTSETDTILDTVAPGPEEPDVLADQHAEAPACSQRLLGAPTLAHTCRLAAGARRSRGDKFLWGVIVVSIFYSLPVVQLVVTYQATLHRTGDQDLCYYNFLCAHPLAALSDFNHVFSNAGYLVLGSAFLVIVRLRAAAPHPHLGVPQHLGVYYAMGVSLVVEGLLSATYHLCPNKMNFQFDSSFMYVMCALCLVALHQARHGDAAARAHAVFTALAAVIFLGFSEVLFQQSSGAAYTAYWAAFVAAKLLFLLWLSLHIYYLGDWSTARCGPAIARTWRGVRSRSLNWRPLHGERFTVLLVMNVANCAFDLFGLYLASHRQRDIPVHLLQVMLLNTVLYIAVYIILKLKHGERVCGKAAASLLACNLLWAVSISFFIAGRTKWAWTPARSRRRNAPCSFLQMYDTHDAWHLVSAAALFHTFLALLWIDDDLVATSRHRIALF